MRSQDGVIGTSVAQRLSVSGPRATTRGLATTKGANASAIRRHASSAFTADHSQIRAKRDHRSSSCM